jgi:hypothetical protein
MSSTAYTSVINNDPYCCNTAWDGVCQNAYDQLSTSCTTPACDVVPPPCVNVNDLAYSTVVVNDPYCCNTGWDGVCQNAYDQLSTSCITPVCDVVPPPCVNVNGSAYTTVVANDPYCCNTGWDGVCQNAYDQLSTSCTTPECDVVPPSCVNLNDSAYALVIANDPYCCNTAWDEYCANAYDQLSHSCKLKLTSRALLDGAYVPASGIMRDDLRGQGLIPLSQPYSTAPFNYAGTETIEASVLDVTGNDAVVDWVLVELRDAATPSTVVIKRAVLIQRDGDIVDVDGTEAVRFSEVPIGTYYLSVLHRNHLGVMTADPYALNFQPSALIDLSAATTATYGSNARRSQAGIMTFWGGNANANMSISYSGSNNDRTAVLNTLGAGIFLSPLAGYDNADVNMNGVVSYSGSNNDRTFILNTLGAGTFLMPIVIQIP